MAKNEKRGKERKLDKISHESSNLQELETEINKLEKEEKECVMRYIG